MYDLKELGLLASALTIRQISFTSRKCGDGWCIVGDGWDVAINVTTMGASDGLLELLDWKRWNPVEDEEATYGCLTASEAIELLEEKGFIPKR